MDSTWRGSSEPAGAASARPSVFEYVERTFTVLAFMLYSDAALTLVVTGGEFASTVEGNPLVRLAYYPFYAGTLLLILARPRLIHAVLGANRLALVLTALALVSLTWSIEPSLTLRRGVALVATTLFGLYVVCRFTPEQLLRLLALSFVIAAWASVAAVVLMPGLAIMVDPYPGSWRGVFLHKNMLGQAMVWLSTTTLLLLLFERHRRWLLLLHLLLSIVLIIKSQSATSLAALGLLPVVVLVVYALHRPMRSSLPLVSLYLFGAVIAGTALVLFLPEVLALFGRDVTFTGRVHLWQTVWAFAQDRYWLGYGYGAFWPGDSSPGALVRTYEEWDMTHSHNGWLETWIGLGFVGVVLLAIMFFLALWRSLRQIGAVPPIQTYFRLTVLSLLFIINILESRLLDYNYLSWVLLTIVGANVRFVPDASDQMTKASERGN